MKDYILALVFVITVMLTKYYNTIATMGNKNTLFHKFENNMSIPIMIGIIVLMQGLLGSHNFKVPERMEKIVSHPFGRMLSMWLIIFSGTQDVELSTLILIMFLIILHFVRTDEERKNHPFFI